MNPFIGLGVALLLITLVGATIIGRRVRGWRRKALVTVVALVVTVATLGLIAFPPSAPVASTGPHRVAVTERWFHRPTSDPALETAPGTREIPALVFAPEGMGGKRPLMVFSHGSFGTYESNESMYRELASHGYVVVSLAHPGHSFTAKISNGKTVYVDRNFMSAVTGMQGKTDARMRYDMTKAWLRVRTDDMTAALDALEAGQVEAPELRDLDPDRIVLSGHSLGGAAALALGRSRPEVRAVVALEAPFFGDITGAVGQELIFEPTPYPRPVLHFYSDATAEKLDSVIDDPAKAEEYRRNVEILRTPGTSHVNIHLQGIGHIGMTDLARESPILTNLIDGGKDKANPTDTLTRIDAETLRFLQERLR